MSSQNRKQIKSFKEGSEFIDYMILNLESGANIQTAFFQAAQNLPPCQIKQECYELMTSCQLGMSFRQTLEACLVEKRDPVFKEIIENIHISLQFGSPIMQILTYLSMHLRLAALTRLEELAARASIKMIFPLVIFIFPVIFILLGAGALKDLIESLHF